MGKTVQGGWEAQHSADTDTDTFVQQATQTHETVGRSLDLRHLHFMWRLTNKTTNLLKK